MSYNNGILHIDGVTIIDKQKLYMDISYAKQLEHQYNIRIQRNHVSKVLLFDEGKSGIYIIKKLANIISIIPLYLPMIDYVEHINKIMNIIIFLLKSKHTDIKILNLCSFKIFMYVPKNISMNLLEDFEEWVYNGLTETDIFSDHLVIPMIKLHRNVWFNSDYKLIDEPIQENTREVETQTIEISNINTFTSSNNTTNTFTQPTTNTFTSPNNTTNTFTQPTTNTFTSPNNTTNAFTQPTTNTFTSPNTNTFTQPTTNAFTQPTTNTFTQPTTNTFTNTFTAPKPITTNTFTAPTFGNYKFT
jgi:hypothetical protein